MEVYELEDVISMLRTQVKQAGGQVAWAKKNRISRVSVNKTLSGRRSPSQQIIRALKLRIVFVPEVKSPRAK